MESLGIPGTPIDLKLLDTLTSSYLQTPSEELENILANFLNREDLYLFTPEILPSSCLFQSKFYFLQGLNHSISKMWSVFPEEAKSGIRQIMLQFISLPYDKKVVSVLNKAFETLTSILKYDLGDIWPTFFEDFYSITSNSPLNSLSFISYFAESVKNDSSNSITSNRASDMIAICILELDKLLAYIYSILEKDPANGEIIKAVLPVLAVLITWPSSVKILQSPIFSLIVDNYIKDPQYALDSCLVLIEFLCSGLPFDGASELIQIFQIVILTLKNISDDFTALPYKIKHGFLVMFDKYVKQFNSIFDQPELRDLIREAYSWIMQVTMNPNDDDDETNSLIEKCYNIWLHSYNQQLYRCSMDTTNFLAEFMPHLRRIIIATYPSPYSITEFLDDFDNKINVFQSKLFSDTFYDVIHDCFTVLAQTDNQDTIQALQERFASYQTLSVEELQSLAYAISATTGTFPEELEGQCIVPMLGQYLQIAQERNEMIDGVERGRFRVCSALVYLFSQYHTLLSRYPILIKALLQIIIKFLVDGDFELRAVSIFSLKTLAQRCSRYLTTIQENENMTYCAMLLDNLPNLFEHLESDNIIELFRAIAIMIRCQNSEQERMEQLSRLLSIFDPIWSKVMTPQFDPFSIETYKTLDLILMCHSNILLSLSGVYSTILKDLLPQFMFIFKTITEAIPQALKNDQLLNSMQSTKSQILFILFKYSYFCFDQSMIIKELMPMSFDIILYDYVNSPNEVKLSASLKYFGAIFNRCSGNKIDEIVFNAFNEITNSTMSILIPSSLENANLKSDYYSLMGSIARQYTSVLASKEPDYINGFIDILQVGANTPILNICESCLQILMDIVTMFRTVMPPQIFGEFFNQQSLPLLQLYFSLLTDLSFKFAFNSIASAIENIFSMSNFEPKREEAFVMLCQMYPNVEPVTIKQLIDELVTSTPFMFSRNKLRDFILIVKMVMLNDPDLFKDEMEPLKQELSQPIQIKKSQLLDFDDLIEEQLKQENIQPSKELIDSLASLSIKH